MAGLAWLPMLAMVVHTISIPVGWGLFFLTFSVASMRPLLLLYIGFIAVDPRSEGGWPLTPIQRWGRRFSWWKAFTSYFPITLHKTVDLAPCFIPAKSISVPRVTWKWWWNVLVWWFWLFFGIPQTDIPTGQRYIFGYHPHGIIGHGAVGGLATEGAGWSELFPGIPVRLLTLASNFWYPFYREYLMVMGISSVSRRSCLNLLRNYQPLCILLGGARESLLAGPGKATTKLIINCRRGFVKIALETGASLVPVIGFGENDIYRQLAPSSRIHSLMTRWLGFTIPMFHARGIWNRRRGLLPYRRPINVVVGGPIAVPQVDVVTPDLVEVYHSRYVAALRSLYDEHRSQFDAPPLEIVE